jgi:serine/threonine protein phosphatase 1
MYYSYTQWIKAPRIAPDDQMIFAVGDIHGCATELLALQKIIQSEIILYPKEQHTVVYLGDYIDRGVNSKQVLEILTSDIDTDVQRKVEEVFLVGNHEQFLLELLNLDPELDRYFVNSWYDNGGTATMESLGVEGYGRLLMANNLTELSHRTAEALGPKSINFLRNLKSDYRMGDYVFVHAGINPAHNMEQQDFHDLVWIREPFLSAPEGWKHDFCVVHGHSISAPTILDHRVGVDVGCFRYGVLCAVQLKDNLLRFIGVAIHPDLFYQDKLINNEINWVWAKPVLINEPLI